MVPAAVATLSGVASAVISTLVRSLLIVATTSGDSGGCHLGAASVGAGVAGGLLG